MCVTNPRSSTSEKDLQFPVCRRYFLCRWQTFVNPQTKPSQSFTSFQKFPRRTLNKLLWTFTCRLCEKDGWIYFVVDVNESWREYLFRSSRIFFHRGSWSWGRIFIRTLRNLNFSPTKLYPWSENFSSVNFYRREEYFIRETLSTLNLELFHAEESWSWKGIFLPSSTKLLNFPLANFCRCGVSLTANFFGTVNFHQQNFVPANKLSLTKLRQREKFQSGKCSLTNYFQLSQTFRRHKLFTHRNIFVRQFFVRQFFVREISSAHKLFTRRKLRQRKLFHWRK